MTIVLGDEDLHGELAGGIRPRWGSTVHHSVLLLSDVLSLDGLRGQVAHGRDDYCFG